MNGRGESLRHGYPPSEKPSAGTYSPDSAIANASIARSESRWHGDVACRSWGTQVPGSERKTERDRAGLGCDLHRRGGER